MPYLYDLWRFVNAHIVWNWEDAMIKRKILNLIMLTGITLEMLSYDEKDLEKCLYGQWKTTELAAEDTYGSTLWFEESYLGRSVIIEQNRTTTSFQTWPIYTNWDTVEHQFWQESDTLSPYRYFYIDSDAGEFLKENSKDATFLRFYKDKEDSSPSELFAVFQDERIAVYLGEGWYLAERYKDAETDLRIKDIYGKWRVKRLVSYEDSWEGNREMFELNENYIESFCPKLIDWETRDDINFYPKDYYDNIVIIDSDEMRLISNGDVLERNQIQEYQSALLERIYYERGRGIHDELGITNKEIQVITGNSGERWKEHLLDNEIIVINESEIIIKIAQGWYLLEKDK